MIDDNYKYIFVENPKTASFAVKKALMAGHVANPDDYRIATVNHFTPRQIEQSYPEKWRDYRSFVVVRNTWDRLLSFFNYYGVQIPSESLESFTFDTWVEAGCPAPTEDHILPGLPEKRPGTHMLCQLQYTEGVDQIIQLHSPDPVNRSTELNNALDDLAKKWDFPLQPVSHGINATRSEGLPEAWTRQSVELIASQFAEEISTFNFQPPAVAA